MYYARETYAERVTHENKILQNRIALLESSDPIQALKADYEKIMRAKDDKIAAYKKGWDNCLSANRELKTRNTQLWEENRKLKSQASKAEKERERAVREMVHAQEQLKKKEAQHEKDTKQNEKLIEQHRKDEEKIQDLELQINALKDEIGRLKAEMDHDGTTSGIPTSQTPRHKKKFVPNSRTKTGKEKGGQPDHEKHEKEHLTEEEITDHEYHTLSKCPVCGGPLEKIEELEPRDEVDYEVVVKKIRHHIYRYVCLDCGRIIESEAPIYLKGKSQYGVQTQATLLALLDRGYVSTGRTKELMEGLMGKDNAPSHGYVGKMQKRAAGMLKEFREDARKESLKQSLLHWDDTVIYINTKRGCFRFYGNSRLALYFAHAAKDAKGIEKDGILANLTSKTTLMHDHLKFNYRKEFLFRNIECIEHLGRDLQKNSNDTGHPWSGKAKKLIQGMIHKRKQYQAEGKKSFTDAETNAFENELVRILTEAKEESEADRNRYYYQDEQALIKRIQEYEGNYFAWVYDFELPTTNNLAERSLRMVKTKQKVMGQFLTEETADEFALVQTYIETCKRNGKDLNEALKRLMAGKPYTLAEVLG